jgi:hypothetical protein
MGLDSCECFSFHHPGVSLDGLFPFVPKASLMKAKGGTLGKKKPWHGSQGWMSLE